MIRRRNPHLVDRANNAFLMMDACEKQVFIHTSTSAGNGNIALNLLINNHCDREYFFLTGSLYSYNAKVEFLSADDGVWHVREKIPTTIPDHQANKIHPANHPA
jgi:hypothetical protein